MSYTPQVNANTLQLYLGICGTGRAVASSTTLDNVAFGTVYNPSSSTFTPDDVGMPIAIVGGGPVDPDMPAPYFVQGAMFHTTIAAYVSPTQVTLAAAPNTSIWNTGFATIILYRLCPFASDVANVPTQFQFASSIAPGTNDTLQFSVLNSLGGTENPYIERFGAIQRGQPVYLRSTDSAVGEIFGGYISRLTVYSYPSINKPYCWSVQCSSWAGLANRRVVPPANPQAFDDVAGDVVFRKLVLDYLSNDGVSVTASSAPNITLAAPVGANIGQLLDQAVSLLTTQTSAWYRSVDAWRNFTLSTRTAVNAPWSITDGSDLFAGSSPYQQQMETSNDQLANNVYFIGQNTLLNALNATLLGNGVLTVFNTPLPIGAVPTITLNGGSQTVGILGVDTGKDWYWSQGSTAITQDSGGVVLTASDTLVVAYLTSTPAVAQAPNVGSLQQLQAIEGTSANYDYSTSISQPILPNDLLALASGYESEYGEPAQTCQLYTLRPGLATGQLQAINLPAAGIPSGNYLIATLTMSIFENVILWSYTAFGGANIGDAITNLTQFINRGQAGLSIITPATPITAAGTAGLTTGQAVCGTSAAGHPLAFPNSVTQGNLLVIVAERNTLLGNPPTVTDTQGLTWTQAIFAQTGGGLPNQISILYSFAASTGPEAINCDSAQFFSIMEFTGILSPSGVFASGSNIGSAPTITLPSAGLLVVTGLAGVPAVPTVTSPEVLLSYHLDAFQPGVAMSSEVVAAAGSFTSSLASAGAGSTSVWASVAFSAKPATSPPVQTINVQNSTQGTVTHTTGALTANLPVFGNGMGDVKVGTKTGTTTQSVTSDGVVSDGGVLIYDANGNATALPVGSDGQVLTLVSGSPAWRAGGGGGGGALALLETQTASSSAELDFTASISSSYDVYVIELQELVPATNGANLLFQISTDGGVTYDTAGHYDWHRLSWDNGGNGVTGANGDTAILLAPGVDNTSAWTASGSLKLTNPLGTAAYKAIQGQTQNLVGGDFVGTMISAMWAQTGAMNAFRIKFSSGNMTSGVVRVYGLSK